MLAICVKLDRHRVALSLADAGRQGDGVDAESLVAALVPPGSSSRTRPGSRLRATWTQTGGHLVVCRVPLTAPPAAVDAPGRGELPSVRVLLADDDPLVRTVLARGLRMHGFHVRDAASGQAAIEAAGSGPVDVLVTDVAMPGMGGRELACRIRQADPDLPVLFLSGYAGGETAFDLGPRDAFVPKPASVTAIVEQIRRLAGHGRG